VAVAVADGGSVDRALCDGLGDGLVALDLTGGLAALGGDGPVAGPQGRDALAEAL